MLIDGNSIVNRAFYGLMGPKMLSTSEGFYTNAIYGFLNILLKFINDEKPTHMAVAFDMKSPTFRHIQYEKYKAQRKGMPQELATQIPVLKDILDAMNILRIELQGYEADDIIGTLAVSSDREGIETIIITGDRDALQLVSERVKVRIPTTRMGRTEVEEYGREQVLSKYGISPEQFIEVKALMGDTSDNIPGVPGIGEKTAFELIRTYGSLENIYSNIESKEIKDRTRSLLVENSELARISKQLATIDVNVPLEISINDCQIKEYNNQELITLLRKLEFNSIISKLNLTVTDEKETKNIEFNHKVIENPSQLSEVIKQIETKREFSFYLLYDKSKDRNILGISLCWEENSAAYINLDNTQASIKDYSQLLKHIFYNREIKKYTFDAKPAYTLLKNLDIVLEIVDSDIVIDAYLINPSKESYNISEMASEFLDLDIFDIGQAVKKAVDKTQIEQINDLPRIVCEQSVAVIRLAKIFASKIKEDGQEKLYSEIELPLTKVLADMEEIGVMVDTEALAKLSNDLETKIATLTSDIFDMAGEKFNINSTRQLGVILFEKLKLPVRRKTKTGYSTDAEVLESLVSKHPIIDKLLEYRQMVKLKSTYTDGLRPLIRPESSRIHSSFNQTVTVTGRISSTEPNLQNIPIKYELGRQIRKMFVAQQGNILVDADYSQIELRVLAHITKDETMIKAFKNGEDIHRITASQIFKVSEDNVNPIMRSRAKAINFGIIYGKREFSLAKDLRISIKEAKEYIDSYLMKYNGVRTYMSEIIEVAKHQGFVTTLFGRRRYLPEMKSTNFNVRSSAERMALNTPIQGTAADIIKIAMVKVQRELTRQNLKSRLILQVHDELIIEARIEELEQVKSILRDCMENAVELEVPLDIDIHWGSNWYDAK